jgi:tRNA uridine 5-carboxymethylaminomethyl modification enzyme
LVELAAVLNVEIDTKAARQVEIEIKYEGYIEKAKKEAERLLKMDLTKLPENLDAWKTLHSLQLGDLIISSAEMERIRKALPAVAIVF